MDSSISTSASTLRSIHQNFPDSNADSLPSSPRSSALPSPPDSPSSDSVSSFPSVSSSFFFSSGAASPPHSHPQSDHARDETAQGLIIPSLTLPPALRGPTPYGKTIGDMRLMVLTIKGAGEGFSSKLLLDDNEDVVDGGIWEDTENGKLLRASTDWIEHHDPHGLEKYEPARNIEILELPGYDHNDNVHDLMIRIKSLIQTPFHTISEVLVPSPEAHSVTANLVSSPSTPLYTALILVVPTGDVFPSVRQWFSGFPDLCIAITSFEQHIIDDLSSYIPVILLVKPSHRHRYHNVDRLSIFRPSSSLALRLGLFRSPETLSILRSEAADRFLRWREVERAIHSLQSYRRRRRKSTSHPYRGIDLEEPFSPLSDWTKSKWESEWEASLSRDVAQRLQESKDGKDDEPSLSACPYPSAAFDPLHLPSLFVFSLSLLREGVSKTAWDFSRALGDWNVRLALLGGFCIGLGAGLLFR